MKSVGFNIEKSLLHNKSWRHKNNFYGVAMECECSIYGASLAEKAWRVVQFYLMQQKVRNDKFPTSD